MSGSPSKVSPRVLLGIVVVAALVLSGIGIAQWVMGRNGGDGEAVESSAPAVSEEAVPVVSAPSDGGEDAVSDGGGEGGAAVADPEGLTRAAVEDVVPLWGSLDIEESKGSSQEWAKSWRDSESVADSFVTQSQAEFLDLFYGPLSMGGDANVDTLKAVELSWQSAESYGWLVTYDRTTTPKDGAPAATETMNIEFTVEVTDAGTAEITSFILDGGDDGDGH